MSLAAESMGLGLSCLARQRSARQAEATPGRTSRRVASARQDEKGVLWFWKILSYMVGGRSHQPKIRHCHIDFNAQKEITRGGGGGGGGGDNPQMTPLIWRWLGARKTYSSALAMELRLSCINPSISSLAWVWWVITRKYGEHSSLQCENAVLINMTDRGILTQGSV